MIKDINERHEIHVSLNRQGRYVIKYDESHIPVKVAQQILDECIANVVQLHTNKEDFDTAKYVEFLKNETKVWKILAFAGPLVMLIVALIF